MLVLIALAPLPFGSNRPWAWSILSLWVGVLVLLDAVAAGFDPVRGESRFMGRVALPFLLFLPVIIWIILQATPDIFTDIAHPIWSEVSAQLGQLLPNYVTISPEMTWDALMVLLAYAGVFWLAARHGRDRKNASMMLKFFVIVSTCYAIYGLVVFFGGWEKVLWFDKTSYRGDLTSTFVNRNSYATYAALGLASSIVVLVNVLEHDVRKSSTWREMLRLMTDGVQKKAWLPVVGGLMTGTALMLTHSRAGFSSGMLGLFVVLIGLAVSRVLPRKLARRSAGGVVCLLVVGYWFSGDALDQRFEYAEGDGTIRFAVYEGVMQGIQLSPATGYGYGTFESGFRQFKPQNVAWATWDLAHNSYLEFSFDAGLISLIMVLATFIVIFARNVSGVVSRHRDQIYPILGTASALIVAVHSLVDFSVQIPAMGICLMFVLALGWSQSWPSKG
ncbi:MULTISPECIES: O-antigen ligase family protein [Thalassospira]|nr:MULTISPECIES: O-antigen ligase family protein [Thalassospira]MDG4720114.1 O-antigen ligase family protein [Thalassospira sp. FZY0004]